MSLSYADKRNSFTRQTEECSQHAEALRNFKAQIRIKTITFSAQVRESVIYIVKIASYTI